jgi:hypothetical protein
MARSKGQGSGSSSARPRPPLIDLDSSSSSASALGLRPFALSRGGIWNVKHSGLQNIDSSRDRLIYGLVDSINSELFDKKTNVGPFSTMDIVYGFTTLSQVAALADSAVNAAIVPLAEISAHGDRIDRLNRENAEGLKAIMEMAAG